GASAPDWRRERCSAAAAAAAAVAAAVRVAAPIAAAPAGLAGPAGPVALVAPVVPVVLAHPADYGSTAGSGCPWSSLPVAAAIARLRAAASPAASAAGRSAAGLSSVARPVPAAAWRVVAAFAAPHRSAAAVAVAGWTIATYCSRTDFFRYRVRDRRGLPCRARRRHRRRHRRHCAGCRTPPGYRATWPRRASGIAAPSVREGARPATWRPSTSPRGDPWPPPRFPYP